MGDEKDAFYVVRKGDIIGVYKNLNDCQAQLGSSVCDPSVSVFKGYCLPREAEEYLVVNGLKNSAYSVMASDVRNDLFGQLSICPFQQPSSSEEKTLDKVFLEKRLQVVLTQNISQEYNREVVGSTSFSASPQSKHAKLQDVIEARAFPSTCHSCIIEFDGASKGNPGLAGAGAVLRVGDGRMVFRLCEGVGIATNNVAEYRGLILGLNCALRKGFKHIRVQGDSKLVCMQVQGLWKTKNQNMADLCKVAKELKDKFMSFEIRHVEREFNTEADAQANQAIYLQNGEVMENCEMK